MPKSAWRASPGDVRLRGLDPRAERWLSARVAASRIITMTITVSRRRPISMLSIRAMPCSMTCRRTAASRTFALVEPDRRIVGACDGTAPGGAPWFPPRASPTDMNRRPALGDGRANPVMVAALGAVLDQPGTNGRLRLRVTWGRGKVGGMSGGGRCCFDWLISSSGGKTAPSPRNHHLQMESDRRHRYRGDDGDVVAKVLLAGNWAVVTHLMSLPVVGPFSDCIGGQENPAYVVIFARGAGFSGNFAGGGQNETVRDVSEEGRVQCRAVLAAFI